MDHRKCGTWARSICFVFAACVLVGSGSPAFATGSQYFINNQPGSNCNDAGPHTEANPWCSFRPVNQHGIFSPGDQILLARGSTWSDRLTLGGSGTESDPITLGAYGVGPNPKLLRTQQTTDICVLLTNVSNWNIEHLEVGQASVGILLHYTELFHQGIRINDVYAHENKGIWSSFSREYPASRGVRDPFAASLNINLSAGILFNLSSDLAFSSSEYVVKEITVSNVRGAHNVDSVAFDAEMGTTDGQDGHNAFQDIVLNGLILSNDDGHAGSAYQQAGLGCSDSLRLLGMMNVTLLDSVLYNEAACYTSFGTAAVILGRVQNVSLTNNIFFGVPQTGSPDETGIDLEFSESQIDFRANLLAENAGPGVEILNIHPGDHTTAVNLISNSFLNNARAIAGAASVWQKSAGPDFAIPSGSIQNSVYSESSGAFFEADDQDSIMQSNNIFVSSFPSYAAEQFSTTQGSNGWRYMYENAPSTWVDIPRYVPADYNGAWEVSPAQYVSAFTMVPGSCDATCDTGGVARVWIAPQTGSINIRGWIVKAETGGGTGVHAEINRVTGQDVIHLWPASGEQQLVSGTDQVGYPTDADNVQVLAGDIIRFEVTANGDNSYDTVSWTPSIAYVPYSRPRTSVPRTVPRLGAGNFLATSSVSSTFTRASSGISRSLGNRELKSRMYSKR